MRCMRIRFRRTRCAGAGRWPEAYQSVDTPEVKAFCETHADEVDFYLWLQWLAYSQFAACWQVSQGYNMPIGLYRDLAVGVAEGGAKPGVTVNFTA